MARILKYWLDVAPRTILNIPADAKIACVHEQNGAAAVWLLTDDHRDVSRRVAFNCVSTGQEVQGQYVGTAHIHNGRTVVHVFMEEA